MLACAPYLQKPNIYEDYAIYYIVVTSVEHPSYQIKFFNNFEELSKMDDEC